MVSSYVLIFVSCVDMVLSGTDGIGSSFAEGVPCSRFDRSYLHHIFSKKKTSVFRWNVPVQHQPQFLWLRLKKKEEEIISVISRKGSWLRSGHVNKEQLLTLKIWKVFGCSFIFCKDWRCCTNSSLFSSISFFCLAHSANCDFSLDWISLRIFFSFIFICVFISPNIFCSREVTVFVLV